jgi:hypothetical protein
MKVGVVTTKPIGPFLKQFGVAALDNGDEKAMATALVAHVNSHGGLGGRKLDPVYYEVDPAKSASQAEDQTMSEICQALTQDQRVEVVLYSFYAPQLGACFAKAGVAYITSEPAAQPTEQQIAGTPLYAGVGPTRDRLAQAYVDKLAARGFWTGSHGTGLLVEGRPELSPIVEQVVVRALRQRGVDVDVVYTDPGSPNNAGSIGAQTASTVLKWSGQGRDRVIFLVEYNFPIISFMQNAEQQHYNPRYGLTTNASPVGLQGSISANQLAGSVGVGIEPALDSNVEGWMVDTPGRAGCVAILKRAQVDIGNKGSGPDGTAMGMCDKFQLTQAAAARVEAAGRPVTAGSIIDAISTMGDAFLPATTQGTSFSPSRRAGGSKYQIFGFLDTCSCFRYLTQPLPLQ